MDGEFGNAIATAHPDPEIRRRRSAVVSRFPRDGADVLNCAAARDLVDAGKPWHDAFLASLARMAGARKVPKRVLEICARRRPGEGPDASIREVAELASRVPEDWLPRPGTADALAFLETCAALSPIVDVDRELAQPMLANCGGRWMRWLGTVEGFRPNGVDPQGDGWDAASAVDCLLDMTSRFADTVVTPTLVRDFGMGVEEALRHADAVATLAVVASHPLEVAVAHAARHASCADAFTADLHLALPPLASAVWPALFPRTSVGPAVEVAPITDSAGLIAAMSAGRGPEGMAGLGAKLGDSIAGCHSGLLHAFSVNAVRGGRTERLGVVFMRYVAGVSDYDAPLAFNPSVDSPVFRTCWTGVEMAVAAVGPGGRDAPDEVWDVLARLAVMVAEDRVTPKVVPTESQRRAGREFAAAMEALDADAQIEAEDRFNSPEDTLRAVAGYRADAAGGIEAAWEAWRPWLPPVLMGASFPEWRPVLSTLVHDVEARTREATPKHLV